MQADDIAAHEQNPFPGRVYNEVGGPNVYADVRTDYSGSAVTSTNFFAVLKVRQRGGTRAIEFLIDLTCTHFFPRDARSLVALASTAIWCDPSEHDGVDHRGKKGSL